MISSIRNCELKKNQKSLILSIRSNARVTEETIENVSGMSQIYENISSASNKSPNLIQTKLISVTEVLM